MKKLINILIHLIGISSMIFIGTIMIGGIFYIFIFLMIDIFNVSKILFTICLSSIILFLYSIYVCPELYEFNPEN